MNESIRVARGAFEGMLVSEAVPAFLDTITFITRAELARVFGLDDDQMKKTLGRLMKRGKVYRTWEALPRYYLPGQKRAQTSEGNEELLTEAQMRRQLLIGALGLLTTSMGCDVEPEKKVEASNGVQVELLTRFDGCAIYKVDVGARNIYVARCYGDSSVTTMWSEGKAGEKVVQTVEVPK